MQARINVNKSFQILLIILHPFQKYKSRYSRRGRALRQRNLVVQRVLPIAPEAPHQMSYPEVRNVSVGTKTVTEIPSNESAADESANNRLTGDNAAQKHFLGVLEDKGGETPKVANSTSSITSAMQILKEGEQQWLNSEVNFCSYFSA